MEELNEAQRKKKKGMIYFRKAYDNVPNHMKCKMTRKL